MHCYNHQTKEAIGLCRHCFKGLCQECCQKNEDSLVCSKSCAQKVNELEEMNERAKSIYGVGQYASKRRFPLSVILYLCMGLLFIALGASNLILYHASLSNYDMFFIAFGILCFLFSFLAWRRMSKVGIVL